MTPVKLCITQHKRDVLYYLINDSQPPETVPESSLQIMVDDRWIAREPNGRYQLSSIGRAVWQLLVAMRRTR